MGIYLNRTLFYCKNVVLIGEIKRVHSIAEYRHMNNLAK